MTLDYLDTSFILSLAIVDDVNHEIALKLEKLIGKPIISKLVVAELYTYFSRVLDSHHEEYIEAMVQYTIKRSHARIMDVDANKLLEIVPHYAPKLKLKTLDLLHILAAHQLGADRIVTLDKDYAAKSSLIKRWLGLEVVTP